MSFRLFRLFGVLIAVYVSTCLTANDEAPSTSADGSATTYRQIKLPFTNARLLINEIDTSTADRSKQFVELAKYSDTESKRDRNNDLKKFKVLFITGGAKIVACCVLSGFLHDRKSNPRRFFYTIGGEGIPDVSFKFSSCQQDRELNGKIPSGDKEPVGILLLYGDDSKEFRNLELYKSTGTTGYAFKRINGAHLNYIHSHLQDFLTYGSTTKYTDCDVFRDIYKFHTSKTVNLVRDWAHEDDDERSINRCGESIKPFFPTSMKYSTPTPGFDNKCESGREFDLENTLSQLLTPIGIMVEPGEKCYMSSTNTDSGTLEISVNTLDENFEETVIDPVVTECGTDNDDIVISLDDEEEIITTVPVKTPKNINDYLNFFKPELVKSSPHILQNCDNAIDQTAIDLVNNDIDLNVLFEPDVCSWIDIKEDEEGPIASCKFCKPLYEKKVLLERESSPLLTKFLKSGHWHSGRNRKADNRRMIQNHMNGKLHKISEQYFSNLDKKLTEQEFNNAMLNVDGEYFKFFEPTLNLLSGVYSAIQMNLAFYKFNLLTEALDFAHFETGFLHKGTDGAKKGLMVISSSMHNELLYHLVTNKPLVNIILDDTTTIAGISVTELLFQTFDSDGNVKVYHYGLLNLQYGGKGKNIFRVFFEQIQKDNLENYISENAVGMTSDGAKTLQSVFFTKLQAKTKRNLLLVHCHSHRVELVIKNAIKKHKYLSTIDAKVNEIHSFFNTRAYKRKLILRQMAIKKAEAGPRGNMNSARRFELKRIHPIRWVSHHLSAYKCVLDRWSVLIDAIDEISGRKDFTVKQRKTAKKLLTYLNDSTFLAHLAFLADIAATFTRLSLVMQERNSNLIGKTVIRKTIVRSLESYFENSGPELLRLVNSANMPNIEDELSPMVLLTQFESTNIVINNKPLTEKNGVKSSEPLCDNLKLYMDSIIEKFGFYFPDTLITDYFEIFFPINLQRIPDDDYTDRFALSTLNVEFKWKYNVEVLFEMWKKCVNSVVADNKFYEYRDLPSATFWLYFLDKYKTECGPQITEIIKIVLVTPGSSASAEQTFSVLSSVQTSRRYSLDVSTVDAQLRIKLNGEKDLNKVNLLAYAREFIQSYTKVDDEFRAKPSKKYANEYDLNGKRLRSLFEKPYA